MCVVFGSQSELCARYGDFKVEESDVSSRSSVYLCECVIGLVVVI